MEFLKELWAFLRVRKVVARPIIIVMLILGSLLILAQGSVVAPFIYTLFRVTHVHPGISAFITTALHVQKMVKSLRQLRKNASHVRNMTLGFLLMQSLLPKRG